MLFVSYAVLAAYGAWLAWQQVPGKPPAITEAVSQQRELSSHLFRLLAVVFVTGAISTAFWPLLVVYLHDRFATGLAFLSIAYLPAAIITSYLPHKLGRWSDRVGRSPMMAVGLVGSGLLLLLLPGLPSPGWLVVLWALEAVGLAMAAPAETALVADLTGSQRRGTGYGLYTLAADLGAACGPFLFTWLYVTMGQAMSFYVQGGMLLASALLVLLLLNQPGHPQAKEALLPGRR